MICRAHSWHVRRLPQCFVLPVVDCLIGLVKSLFIFVFTFFAAHLLCLFSFLAADRFCCLSPMLSFSHETPYHETPLTSHLIVIVHRLLLQSVCGGNWASARRVHAAGIQEHRLRRFFWWDGMSDRWIDGSKPKMLDSLPNAMLSTQSAILALPVLPR